MDSHPVEPNRMRSLKRALVAALVGGFAFVPTAEATSVAVAGTNTISRGAATVTIPPGVTIGCDLKGGESVAFDHDGTFAALVLEPLSGDDYYNFVDLPPGAFIDVIGPMCTGLSRGRLNLAAGTYRISLLTDGTQADAVLSLPELSGMTTVSVDDESLGESTYSTINPTPGHLGVLSAGSLGTLDRRGSLFVAQWSEGLTAASREGLCVYNSTPIGPRASWFAPECPLARFKTTSTGTLAGGTLRSFTTWGAPAGDYALGAWSLRPGVVESQGVIAYWLPGPT